VLHADFLLSRHMALFAGPLSSPPTTPPLRIHLICSLPGLQVARYRAPGCRLLVRRCCSPPIFPVRQDLLLLRSPSLWAC
jgi:hypothetical protein